MAQIMAGDLRKGVTFLYENNIMTVVDFQHVKPGKGAAFVRTKMKNVVTGSVLEKTFNPTEKFDLAHIETKNMEYLYNDGEFYYFMDSETYEQIPLNHSQVEDALNFVKENMAVTMKFFQGAPFSVEPPPELRRAARHDLRARGRRQHRHQRDKARHRGNGLLPAGPDVRERRRHHPHRHPHGRIYVPRLSAAPQTAFKTHPRAPSYGSTRRSRGGVLLGLRGVPFVRSAAAPAPARNGAASMSAGERISAGCSR